GSALAIYFHYVQQIPELQAAVDYRPAIVSKVFDRNGNLIAEFALERRIIVPLTQVPDVMQQAIISIEDEHFYSHNGLDIPGILRAAIKNLQAGEIVQGGSTITQQLAKSLFLSRERTLARKIKEALLALQLENVITKDRILELYLNQVYFGSGAYGIESAARTYFNKSCSELTLAEAAMLAGLPKAPSKFSPLNNPEIARERRNHVINRMLENGYINEQQAREAKASDLQLHPGTQSVTQAPYFVEILRRTLESELGSRELHTEGYQIYTTLDLDYQHIAEDAVYKGLHEITKKRRWRGPDPAIPIASTPPPIGRVAGAEIVEVQSDQLTIRCAGMSISLPFQTIWIKNKYLRELKSGDHVWCIIDEYDTQNGEKSIKSCRLTQEPTIEAALVSIVPTSGEILAWVGGYDFNRSQFDRVSQSKRQPGSAFKPFIYAAALDDKFTAADVIYDTPIVIEKTWEKPVVHSMGIDAEEEKKEYWKPHNYSEEFFGATTLHVGLAKSRNIISIRLLEKVGIDNVIRIARRLGIKSPQTRSLSLALGSSEVSLLELTQAYGGFASQGIVAEPMMVRRILDRDGETVREYYPSLRRGLREDTAYLINNLLQAVVNEGTGYRARILQRPVGGKTGTTNQFHDAWFIGFVPQVATGTWVGADVLETIYPRATGASAALPIWLEYMEGILDNYEIVDFQVPKGIVFADVCGESGLLATPNCTSTIKEAFREGTEPLVFCDLHRDSTRKTRTNITRDWDKLEEEISPPEITPTPLPEFDSDDPEADEFQSDFPVDIPDDPPPQ
ncbi:PBP1A family penicillin-binding protein, partial [bacterium]|nr:PBP1A family penicillin-binding protein [candidate division CSSED10-310 bacterium]